MSKEESVLDPRMDSGVEISASSSDTRARRRFFGPVAFVLALVGTLGSSLALWMIAPSADAEDVGGASSRHIILAQSEPGSQADLTQLEARVHQLEEKVGVLQSVISQAH